MMTNWTCFKCTFLNRKSSLRCCEVCLTDRPSLKIPKSDGSHTTSTQVAASPNATTPVLLRQNWRLSHSSHTRVKIHSFDSHTNSPLDHWYTHEKIYFDVPSFCGSSALEQSKRSSKRVGFLSALQAIMLCKASLLRDYAVYDSILLSKSPRRAMELGRDVTPWDQVLWDRMICPIARAVMVAKVDGLSDVRRYLLSTGKDVIAKAGRGEYLWGVNLDIGDRRIGFPSKWKGVNILGWALMEARDEAARSSRRTVPLLEQPMQKHSKRHKFRGDPHSLHDITLDLEFASGAFHPLQTAIPTCAVHTSLSATELRNIVESSIPESKTMLGERGRKKVTKMLAGIYRRGLFMHGDPDSPVNQQIIPSLRHVFFHIQKIPPGDSKRKTVLMKLLHACQDCQQVQARVILRLYGDFTAQSENFEQQLKYSLVPLKDVALQVLISNYHGGNGGVGAPEKGCTPTCDLDHVQVQPFEQRPHLISGYLSIIGDQFGLDGITAAKNDRFLTESQCLIERVHGPNGHTSGSNAILQILTNFMSVKEWLSTLLADINNQASGAERMIDQGCIFTWVKDHMKAESKHLIFYDSSRSQEFSDLDPKEPLEEHKYEPFLSPKVLVDILLKAGMLSNK